MKRKILICIMAFIIGCAIGSLTGCATRDDIEFYTDISEPELNSGIVFSADYCDTCRRYRNEN